ncbi:MAG: undecaprenyl-diphosphate phosphatase, partial [candidate division WOR-3 bacterium]
MALLIGIFQCFSLIPGTSRSGATIIGGMLVGLDRRSATEFSFLLSVPTMLIATSYEFYKGRTIILSSDMNFIIVLIGFVTSFVFAYISVKWLLSFVSNHSLVIFGIYRIVVGLIFLILFR